MTPDPQRPCCHQEKKSTRVSWSKKVKQWGAQLQAIVNPDPRSETERLVEAIYGTHAILCAWCPKGTRTVIGYSTVAHSHGLCDECLTTQLRGIHP